eukprot:CAMPEP_0178910178 /NCGR_PEP_ID=MMETSP0786-20121207/8949_1 /TAXON_ID=186022 /ORGANISM="Thalassionema frauenfeldii, Strain CCMP 1798" /LENGTH=269 /DNA_ID=CAMNT_0020582393 /DNA_START=41 /DNA_END=847 /DNA_ORIENTATION=-
MSNSLLARCYLAHMRQALFIHKPKFFSISKPCNDSGHEEKFEWIPPNRPLSGDKGQSNLYAGDEEEEEETATQPVDWLVTRRANQSPIAMGLPNKNKRFSDAELEVLEGVLLSSKEIEKCITAMGGTDYKLIKDSDADLAGLAGLIIVTATSSQHLNLLADTLVRQLKQRKLQDYGVEGALNGADGNGGNNETWLAVDCDNFIVHIMLEDTRRHLNIEPLWSGADGFFELNASDENAVDDYVARNPIPEDYGSVDTLDVTDTISRLERW